MRELVQVLPRYNWFTCPVSLIWQDRTKQLTFIGFPVNKCFDFSWKAKLRNEESAKKKWSCQNSLWYAILSRYQTWSEISRLHDLWFMAWFSETKSLTYLSEMVKPVEVYKSGIYYKNNKYLEMLFCCCCKNNHLRSVIYIIKWWDVFQTQFSQILVWGPIRNEKIWRLIYHYA